MEKKFNFVLCSLLGLVFCLTLIAGTLAWQKYGVGRLTSQDLARLPGVSAVEVIPPSRQEKVPTVVVKMAPTDNLRLTYRQITKESDRLWGVGGYRLEILDQRDAALQRVYDMVSFSVQQARQTGQWQELPPAVTAAAAQMGIKAQCYVDNENVYLALTADQGYLYEVVAR